MNKSIIDMTVKFNISRGLNAEESIDYHFQVSNRLGSTNIDTRWPMTRKNSKIMLKDSFCLSLESL